MFFFIYVTHICMMYHEINVSENNVLTLHGGTRAVDHGEIEMRKLMSWLI